jgi:Fe-S cluster biogenesis protein NfuA
MSQGTKSFQADGRLTLPATFMREAVPALQLHLQRLPLSVVARLEDSGGGSTSTHTAEGVTTVRLSGACRSYEVGTCCRSTGQQCMKH